MLIFGLSTSVVAGTSGESRPAPLAGGYMVYFSPGNVSCFFLHRHVTMETHLRLHPLMKWDDYTVFPKQNIDILLMLMIKIIVS